MGFIVDFIAGKKKAKDTREVADRNLDIVERIYGDSVEREEPFRQHALGALGGQGDALGFNGQEGYDRFTDNFKASPFATLPFDEGQLTLEGSAANRGNLLSGQTGKDLADYGHNKANNNFLNYYNGLSSTARGGQVSNQNLNNAGQNYSTGAQGANNQYLESKYAGNDAGRNAGNSTLGSMAKIFGFG